MKSFIFLLSLTIVFFSCQQKTDIKPMLQDIKELVFASGQLEWDDAYYLTSQTDGVLTGAQFEVGNQVKQGDVLATIDNKMNDVNTQISEEQVAIANQNVTANSPALQQLSINIQFAESKYNEDKLLAERYQNLYNSQSTTKVQMESAQLTEKNSLANLNALKKQYDFVLQQAKQQNITIHGQLSNNQILQSYNKITVTEKGTVIKKHKNNGDYVRKGDIIATIANEQKVEVVLNVDENSIAKIQLGQPVFIKLNTNKNIVYNGTISEILSAFDVASQSFICKAVFEIPLQKTLYGTQLEANILVNEKKQAMLIPRQYVGYGNIVNVKGQDEPVIITSGIVSSDYVEVLSGLTLESILLPLKP